MSYRGGGGGRGYRGGGGGGGGGGYHRGGRGGRGGGGHQHKRPRMEQGGEHVFYSPTWVRNPWSALEQRGRSDYTSQLQGGQVRWLLLLEMSCAHVLCLVRGIGLDGLCRWCEFTLTQGQAEELMQNEVVQEEPSLSSADEEAEAAGAVGANPDEINLDEV